MKSLINKSVFAVLLVTISVVSLTTTSCTKETIIKETFRDTIIIKKDSIVYKYDVAKWLTKRWTITSNEVEAYVNGIMTDKYINANLVALGYFVDFKSNGTFTSLNVNGNQAGTWELVTDNVFVLDKNTIDERYYYILTISEKNFVRKGPYTKTGVMQKNFLETTNQQAQ